MLGNLHYLLYPRSVAIVGASVKEHSVGRIIVENLLKLGFKGEIYPVNPKYSEVLGLKCYASLRDISGEIDVAVVAIPAPKVLGVLEDCGWKKVKHVVIVSSGFGELGELGRTLETRILEIAGRHGMRILGPNTTGILNLENGFTTAFTRIPENVRRGNVSLIVQTGVFAASLLRWIITCENLGLSKVIGLGNKLDIDEVDALNMLKDDEETEVIMMYIEGVKNGREFLKVAREVSREKPIVVVKSGKTKAGWEAARSHTGTLAGRDEIFDAVCRQAGIIRAVDFEDAVDYVKCLSMLPPPKSNSVGVLSYSGAGCVIAADAVEEWGLKLAALKPSTYSKISKLSPPYWSKSNPIDLGPILESEDAKGRVSKVLELVLEDGSVDSIVLIIPVVSGGEEPILWEVGGNISWYKRLISECKAKYPSKPIIVVVNGSKEAIEEAKEALESIGIPVFTSITRAVRALSKIYWWHSRRSV